MMVRENAVELQLVMFGDIRQIYQPKNASSNALMLHQNAVQGPSISHTMGYGGNLLHTIYNGDLALCRDAGNSTNRGFNMYACQTY